MAGRVFRQILANAIQVVSATGDKGLQFSGNQRKDVEELVGGFDPRVNRNLLCQGNAPCLGKKRERESGRDTEPVLHVPASLGKQQLEVCGGGGVAGYVGKIDRFLDNVGADLGDNYAAEIQVRNLDPLLFRWCFRWPAKKRL